MRSRTSSGDKAEIWGPVQSAGGTREDVAKTLGIPQENVTVNVTLLGGGFGRKSKCDYAIEAALLSKELGAPVKVQWTREDDVRNGFLHTVSVERIEAGLDKSGKVTAWRHRSVAPSIASTFAARYGASGAVRTRHGACRHALRDRQRPVRESGSGRAYPHRLVPLRIEHPARLRGAVHGRRTRTGHQTRSKGHAAGADRLVRGSSSSIPVKDLWNYGEPYDSYPIDTARLRKVVELVADKGGWGRSVPKGHGLGIAAHRSFVSYIATIVEVAVDDKGKLTVPRVDTAIDCGTYVNPERIQSQIEGAAIMGMSLAKHGAITFKDGKVQQGNFDDFPVIRIDESPAVTNVYIVPPGPDTPPSGVGEPGVPPFAPALINAIFAATGKRIRALPIGKQLEA